MTSEFGVLWLKHNLIIGDKTYVRTVLGASTSANTFNEDRYENILESDEKLRILAMYMKWCYALKLQYNVLGSVSWHKWTVHNQV